MLKLLLGHWKAHRKKPSLLPEDGDVHFEDPSTINPLFEDSDSSISSTKGPKDSKSEEKHQTVSQVENYQNTNANDVPAINELIDVSVPTHSKDSAISDLVLPKEKITNTEKGESSLTSETISESDNVAKSEPFNSLESKSEDLNLSSLESEVENVNVTSLESSSHENITTNISSKGNTDSAEIKSEEKMRIYNQPSTSAIRERKNSFDKTAGEKNATQLPSSKSADVQNVNKQTKEQKTSKENKLNKLGTNESFSAQIKESSPSFILSDESEKPAKLRARAIDELIKKFQGPITESDNTANNVIKPEKKHLPNQQPETEEVNTSVSKNKVKNSSSPPTEFNRNVNKVIKPERKELPKATKSITETVIPNKSDQEIEALSNIFKFPPPPPLENLQNESNLHGKILKELKLNSPKATSSKIKENTDNLTGNEAGKTRSDSSLDRTRTASSNKPKENKEKLETDNKKETSSKIQEPSLKEATHRASTGKKSPIKDLPLERKDKESKKTNETSSELKSTKENKYTEEKMETKAKIETKIKESEPQTSSNSVPSKKESSVSDIKSDFGSKVLHKSSFRNVETTAKSPVQKHKSSISKATSKPYSPIENENVKSHSEDSGITRGDQISSETTQETPVSNPPEETTPIPNPSRKNKKEKKLKPNNKKICKNCRHAHDGSPSIKRSQYDEYYDGLAGARHLRRGRHSDSWTSDLSWEEKELFRRLRSRKGTVRSNTPSTRSRISKHRFIDENHFRRHHNVRRSLSDDSTFYGSSLCSCDECWAQYIKDYAYGRASLRGMPPIQEMCTCRSSRHNFLGRRVQFRSDTIHEASPSERTTTPAPPAENKEDDGADDKSQKSTKTKDGDSVLTNPDSIKDKKSKNSEEAYRFVTPWELEEWDLLMRKQLLQSRRRRARCMGIMALAMVVFIGLVVAILMVYLRRKVL